MGFRQKNLLYRETEVVVFYFSLISYDVFIKPPQKKEGGGGGGAGGGGN